LATEDDLISWNQPQLTTISLANTHFSTKQALELRVRFGASLCTFPTIALDDDLSLRTIPRQSSM
jgi:hypothetical protein